MEKLRNMKKKGQEEIVGFVLIMVIVAIVFLIFLGISIRQGGEGPSRESTDVYHFLESAMEQTSDCALRFIPDYSDLGELFEECYSGNNCLDGRNACEVLNQTLTGSLEAAWVTGEEARINGYEFVSEYVAQDSEEGEEIISISKGNCTGVRNGASYLAPAFPGKIQSSLVICI